MSEKEFVDGLMIKPPRDNAPSFVKGSISIKRKNLGNWLRGKEDDWINLDIKESQGGKWYAEVNNWKPSEQSNNAVPANAVPQSQPVDDDIPF